MMIDHYDEYSLCIRAYYKKGSIWQPPAKWYDSYRQAYYRLKKAQKAGLNYIDRKKGIIQINWIGENDPPFVNIWKLPKVELNKLLKKYKCIER